MVVRALQALTDIRPPFPTPWGKESKIPEIGVDLFCLKSVFTEFHVFNSIGFRKDLKLWSPFWPLWGRNFENPLFIARLGVDWHILWNFHGNRSRGLGCALSVRVSEDFAFYIKAKALTHWLTHSGTSHSPNPSTDFDQVFTVGSFFVVGSR